MLLLPVNGRQRGRRQRYCARATRRLRHRPSPSGSGGERSRSHSRPKAGHQARSTHCRDTGVAAAKAAARSSCRGAGPPQKKLESDRRTLRLPRRQRLEESLRVAAWKAGAGRPPLPARSDGRRLPQAAFSASRPRSLCPDRVMRPVSSVSIPHFRAPASGRPQRFIHPLTRSPTSVSQPLTALLPLRTHGLQQSDISRYWNPVGDEPPLPQAARPVPSPDTSFPAG